MACLALHNIVAHDRLIAAGAYADVGDGGAGEFLEAQNVKPSEPGQQLDEKISSGTNYATTRRRPMHNVSPRTARQIATYELLLPELKINDLRLSDHPELLKETDSRVAVTQGSAFQSAAEALKTWIKNDDYESLIAALTNPGDEFEAYRVVSPLISVFGHTVSRSPRVAAGIQQPNIVRG